MKVLKTLNDYLLIEEINEKSTSTITIIDEVKTQQKGKVIKIPVDFDEAGTGIHKGSTVLFYTGTGTRIGKWLLVHVQNILGLI